MDNSFRLKWGLGICFAAIKTLDWVFLFFYLKHLCAEWATEVQQWRRVKQWLKRAWRNSSWAQGLLASRNTDGRLTVTAPSLLETWLAINTTLINESCGLCSLEMTQVWSFFYRLLVTAGMDSDAAITKSFTVVAERRGKKEKISSSFPSCR